MDEKLVLPNENDKEKITAFAYDSFDELIESGTHVPINGKKYYYLPVWFERAPGGSGWYVHNMKDLPKDLIEYIIKARMGGDNPRPDQPIIEYPFIQEKEKT